ncbi:transposase [Natrinema sp. 1APR25-10V2]|uniref:transposase n=1 Tax=Natrinema sp. 1APR25-10V2 TaxID=2951081 RepID=UPI0028745076|nr:transposase [Natrinema sp. 1APR25-10V2]MDS0477913.1 transposase [Natrinema sp. 1APR25-10V2]
MAEGEPTTLDEFTAGTTTESVARTLRLKLETSNQKNSRIRDAVDDWQTVAKIIAAYLPSFPPYRWSGRDTQLTRVAAREAPDDLNLYAHDRNAAAYKAQEAFNSWNERGRDGERPIGEFGNSDYLRICSCCTKPSRRVEIVENERGYGLRAKIVPREDPLWFHIDCGEYQREYLERLVAGDLSYGALEFRLNDGDLFAHLSIEEEVEVYRPEDVSTRIGVDLGETTLYAAAVVDDEEIVEVEMESGAEFRHHRERLDRRRTELMEAGDLRGVRAIRGERERYTNHVTNTATREIVRLAERHTPAVIHLENLTDYRETATDPIHDWPYARLQEQISYKATERGIPVRFVDPAGTSTTCRKCGQRTPEARTGDTFHCRRCDYEVHADVNGAINIALRAE